MVIDSGKSVSFILIMVLVFKDEGELIDMIDIIGNLMVLVEVKWIM